VHSIKRDQHENFPGIHERFYQIACEPGLMTGAACQGLDNNRFGHLT
jgi:hypothetical protein